MILKRKIYQKLLKWKNETKGEKAILIEGARRIGKSTIPGLLSRHEKRVVFKEIQDGSHADQYEETFFWLAEIKGCYMRT